MQALPSRPRLDQIAQKWHDLAQRRLDYYTELYRSGRWQLYYTQDRFAIRMLDVINAAKQWRELAGAAPPEQPVQPSLLESTGSLEQPSQLELLNQLEEAAPLEEAARLAEAARMEDATQVDESSQPEPPDPQGDKLRTAA
jgi:uncharacterized repeat protein (TIGR03809 family)